jgi:SAM-dependent methyltransferase
VSFPELFSKTRDLIAAAQTMGVLGAELRLRQMGKEGHPRVRDALQAVLKTLEPGLLDGLEPGQVAAIVGQLNYGLQDALDLIREPERAPGWAYTDSAILQERGRGSRGRVPYIANLARQRAALAATLGNGKFLDIGTGVGWLAIEAAKTWPGMQIIGLDIWEPSLKLARTNIATEGLQDRITLRRQSITDIDDDAAFDIIWMPSPFLPREVVHSALPRIARALTPAGFLLFGMFSSRPNPLGQALSELLTIRSGGYPWKFDEVKEQLGAAGFRDIEHAAGDESGSIVIAKRD